MKMSKVEHTKANCEKLAEAIVDSMELKDMIRAIYEQELEFFENDESCFYDHWDVHFGDEDE